SRGALLYPLWYAALGFVAVSVRDCAETRRLRAGAFFVAALTLSAHLALPALNDVLHFAGPGEGSFDRVRASLAARDRLEIAVLALRVFWSAPIIGIGMGGFAGAAFDLGLDPALSPHGEIWTSAHNLPLQLLAETGSVGTALVLVGLCLWAWEAARSY